MGSLFPSGAMLSARVPNKNVVEIDNSISVGCAPREHHLTVIGFNAQRGARWPLIAHAIRTLPALKRADVVLLNELDVGMARSGNLGPRGPVSGSGRLWPEPNGSGRRGSAATGSGASL